MKPKAFKGQWVDIFSAGKHTDSVGVEHDIDVAFLEQVVNNFLPSVHEPPAVIGHPKEDAPAYAWASALRVLDGVLQAQFCDGDPSFEALVEEGKFKKRSASFYLDTKTAPAGRAPQLRHVGFLGAQPPSVKGLREIQFNEGEAITFEPIAFSEGDRMEEKEEDKRPIGEQIADYFRKVFGSKEGASGASFSEAEIDKRIKAATDALTASFNEKLTTIQTENEKLQERVNTYGGSATRAEIVSFCERLGAGKLLPAFRSMGVIEFMELLATMPDKKVGIISFAEEGGKEVEKKVEVTPLQFFQNFLKAMPAYVEFGEKFGDLTVKGSGAEIVDPEAMDAIRDGMGTKKAEGGGK